MNIKEDSTELKRRVMICRGKLQHIGVIGAKQSLYLRFPAYKKYLIKLIRKSTLLLLLTNKVSELTI